MKRFIIAISSLAALMLLFNPHTAAQTTDYTFRECLGSSMPYPDVSSTTQTPDSLRPIMINHVGRHGARYMSSGKAADNVRKALKNAVRLRTITPLGRRMLRLTEQIIERTAGRWGVLDTLGKAEQMGIGMRMYSDFPSLMRDGRIKAISSYVPRCIMSMYEMTHQIARLDDKVEIHTSSGRQNNPLLRFFSDNRELEELFATDYFRLALNEASDSMVPRTVLRKMLGSGYPYNEIHDQAALTMDIYSCLAATAAMELRCDISQYVTREEFNAMWSFKNYSQHLVHSASAISDAPAKAARALLDDIITTTDRLIEGDSTVAPVQLRFGHAETLMPLLALMRIPGCYLDSDNPDEVSRQWLDFRIVPMAANFRIIVFRGPKDVIYIRADLNEQPINLIEDDPRIYLPWNEAKAYLLLRSM